MNTTSEDMTRAVVQSPGLVGTISGIMRSLYGRLDSLGTYLHPVFDLSVRLGLAWIFWKSGLTKTQSWESTVMLFQYEYKVPLLPPEIAAFLGTGVELIMPALLAAGLAGRMAALLLFVFNIIAVISYPTLNIYGQLDHLWWGALLLIPIFRGPGKLSIDHLIRTRLWGH